MFNRWGEKSFESNDVKTAWIGNVFGGQHYVPNGVYVWVLEYRYLNSSFTERLNGSVTVVR